MGGFEHIFSFLGLLLGFTVVEVLGGFVRSTKLVRVRHGGQPRIRMGWMTPLLALFVVMDVATYWIQIWWVGRLIPVSTDSIFIGLAMAGGYYFAASMVFPDDPSEWPDLDRWFWLHKRQVLGPIMVVNLSWTVIFASLNPDLDWLYLVLSQGIYFLCLGVAYLDQRRWPIAMGLGLLIFMLFLEAAMQLVGRIR
jgi:hypothetical protein